MKFLSACLFIGTAALAQMDVPPTFKDVSYGPHERNVLDLWQAKSEKATPLVIFIHGGGWAGGDKRDVLPKLRAFLIAKGISVASINYRYSTTAILPAPVHDAARAVQFLRSKAAEWRLDPARFAAYGVSAGGCTTLWLAFHDDLAQPGSSDPVARQSTRLQSAVGIAPQTCLEPQIVREWVGDQVFAHAMIGRAIGVKKADEVRHPDAQKAGLLREFSPINHVTKDDPPVLLAFTHRDPLPATSAGSAIHHAMFGIKLKEKADATGTTCMLRIEDQKPGVDIPKPETFLWQQLTEK